MLESILFCVFILLHRFLIIFFIDPLGEIKEKKIVTIKESVTGPTAVAS